MSKLVCLEQGEPKFTPKDGQVAIYYEIDSDGSIVLKGKKTNGDTDIVIYKEIKNNLVDLYLGSNGKIESISVTGAIHWPEANGTYKLINDVMNISDSGGNIVWNGYAVWKNEYDYYMYSNGYRFFIASSYRARSSFYEESNDIRNGVYPQSGAWTLPDLGGSEEGYSENLTVTINYGKVSSGKWSGYRAIFDESKGYYRFEEFITDNLDYEESIYGRYIIPDYPMVYQKRSLFGVNNIWVNARNSLSEKIPDDKNIYKCHSLQGYEVSGATLFEGKYNGDYYLLNENEEPTFPGRMIWKHKTEELYIVAEFMDNYYYPDTQYDCDVYLATGFDDKYIYWDYVYISGIVSKNKSTLGSFKLPQGGGSSGQWYGDVDSNVDGLTIKRNRWSGYKCIYTESGYFISDEITHGLIYGDAFTPSVGDYYPNGVFYTIGRINIR